MVVVGGGVLIGMGLLMLGLPLLCPLPGVGVFRGLAVLLPTGVLGGLELEGGRPLIPSLLEV